MFRIKWLEESDYSQLCDWWNDWGWTPPPTQQMLPDNGKCGLMVSKDGVDICAGFVYTTNSSFALVEFVISNKNYREKDRKEALEYLITNLDEVAKQLGFTTLFTSVKHKSLINIYEKCGYEKGSTNTTELIKTI